MKIKLAFITLLCTSAGANAACGTASCPINTQWDAQGLSNERGLRVDLRYSYTRPNKLRSGSNRVAPEAPANTGLEIENRRTINQLVNADIDYAINERWSVAVSATLFL